MTTKETCTVSPGNCTSCDQHSFLSITNRIPCTCFPQNKITATTTKTHNFFAAIELTIFFSFSLLESLTKSDLHSSKTKRKTHQPFAKGTAALVCVSLSALYVCVHYTPCVSYIVHTYNTFICTPQVMYRHIPYLWLTIGTSLPNFYLFIYFRKWG